MQIGGVWVGWGLGPPPDDNPKVAEFKEKLKRKFSYARTTLADDSSTRFTVALASVVMEAQHRWGFPVTGIIDFKFQVKAGWVKPPAPTKARGTLYTCQGTQPSDMWFGPPGDTARAVEDLYWWQPIGGRYQAFPMNTYINEAKAELKLQISRRPVGDPINLAGYSQGAIVISEVFQEMKNPGDALHHRLKDVKRAVTWGNPSRELGVENGNRFAGWPLLGGKKRGIMENDRRLTDTPDWWMDFANKGDLYCDTPNDDTGEDQTAICMIIMGNLWGGPDSIVNQILEVIQRPLLETMAMMKALMNAGLFFGGGIKPHLNYPVEPAIRYLRA